MLKKVITFLIWGIILFNPYFARANVVFSEIMYDLKAGSDTGREWIEIYNDTLEEIDISKSKLFEADTNHNLKLAEGSEKIPAHGYALLVSDYKKFKTDWPSISGNIFDSTFSLNNSGESFILKDEKLNTLDEFSYQTNLGGAGDGRSLQKINGVWRGEVPTPLAENKITLVSTPPPSSGPSAPRIEQPVKILQKKSTSLEKNIVTPRSEEAEVQTLDTFTSDPKESILPIIIFAIFLGISTFGVFFLRQKRVPKSAEDDFEILED